MEIAKKFDVQDDVSKLFVCPWTWIVYIIWFEKSINIHDSSFIFLSSGAHMRRASAELAERRRASFGSRSNFSVIISFSSFSNVNLFSLPIVGLRADGTLDPHHAAILFRDSRGVSWNFCINFPFHSIFCSVV